MLTLWTVGAIAEIFECHEHTVRATIRRWQQQGLGGLWEAPGRGTKRLWQEEDMQYLEQCLEQQERTYNSMQLATVLEQERQVNLSADRIRRILQKRGRVETNATQPAQKTRPAIQTT